MKIKPALRRARTKTQQSTGHCPKRPRQPVYESIRGYDINYDIQKPSRLDHNNATINNEILY
eukprot:scaffold20670_cov36-Cyclotella_meneghiniana.AAC.1